MPYKDKAAQAKYRYYWYRRTTKYKNSQARKWRRAHRDPAKHAAYNSKWLKDNPQKAKNVELRKRYNITNVEFNALLEKQNNVCAICSKPESYIRYGKIPALAVDHDHTCCTGSKSCGKCIRGLLCRGCNLVLGYMEDNSTLLRKAADYIDLNRVPQKEDKGDTE